MCGICGAIYFQRPNPATEQYVRSTMVDMMARRGPNDAGSWSDPSICTLGFRRLSILDLTPAAHQPMITPDGRFALVFNGEVYNFRELRAELEQLGMRFRSTGDSEVVLQSLVHWGIQAFERFNGMFAIGLYDRDARTLLLARDHAGIKPLYYYISKQGFTFASQYDQILSHPWARNANPSRAALGLYVRLGYIPAPFAFLENSGMVEPGRWMRIDANQNIEHGTFFQFDQPTEPDLHGREAMEAVTLAVTESVRRQMVSDVPVGTFLSGGVDSPLVAAEAASSGDSPLPAFTIGTYDSRDESRDAKAYAEALGLQHYIRRMNAEDALSIIDDAVAACGEPFADYSIFPSLLVADIASQHVRVMLSGDGGDELFWGYEGRFGSVLKNAPRFSRPRWVRRVRWLTKNLLGMSDESYNSRHYDTIGEWYRDKHTKLHPTWLRRVFPDLPDWPDGFSAFSFGGSGLDETAQWTRWNEFVVHLPMVLLKVDRASMYHSLEVRVPLLDRQVVQTAARVHWQSCLDLDAGLGKLPLRGALAKHVDTQTEYKRGFSVPMSDWLRKDLRNRFQQVLWNRSELAGLPLDQTGLRSLFQSHLRNEVDYGWGLWALLSLALWEEAHWKRPHG